MRKWPFANSPTDFLSTNNSSPTTGPLDNSTPGYLFALYALTSGQAPWTPLCGVTKGGEMSGTSCWERVVRGRVVCGQVDVVPHLLLPTFYRCFLFVCSAITTNIFTYPNTYKCCFEHTYIKDFSEMSL